MNTITHKIFDKTSDLPSSWNTLADKNIFLSKEYLHVLEKSSPQNMTCNFIGLFKNEELVGVALSQFLNLNLLESFGERDKTLKTTIRNFIFKNFGSHVLFIGNNMITGQNAFIFNSDIKKADAIKALHKAAKDLGRIFAKKGLKTHIITFKDFPERELESFPKKEFADYFQFTTQPNMVFDINHNWKCEQDYIDSLSKKYRDQFKRARKKASEIEKRKLEYDEILKKEDLIYELYFHVAKNAPFNTFFLAKNHFSTFKQILDDRFLFYGYFINNNLIGFSTLIKNGEVMDTYFLGYDDTIQREKMLYLNMLYDMIAYSINKGFKKIIFSRTALEIKSSVGAKPIPTHGLIKHKNKLINQFISKIFYYLEPETKWKQRNPFK